MIYKCKMCGGSLKFNKGETICTCEYCGTKQTLPKLDSEKKKSLLDRADSFRRNNDYDKASVIYEQILADEKTDSEVYWLNMLCRYGIEYVEDPRTKRRIPTINRVQYDSILKDKDYLKALELANPEQKEIYEQEAAYINKVQSQILDISNKEEPFDIFICYKETDDNGRRTEDSVLAQDIYKELTNEGYKVFFSRITLEDKLGTAYEPYIFAALNSAKVMLVIGTKKEHFEAVWVKNEWSRYLSLIKSGQKKLLVPCYKNMDPYDLPEEFSYLQAQDLNKLGYMQDLLRGIDKSTDISKTASKKNELLSNTLFEKKNGTRTFKVLVVLFIVVAVSFGLYKISLMQSTNKKAAINNYLSTLKYDGGALTYKEYIDYAISNSSSLISQLDIDDYDDFLFNKYIDTLSNAIKYEKQYIIEHNESREEYGFAALRFILCDIYKWIVEDIEFEERKEIIKNTIINSADIYSIDDAKKLIDYYDNRDLLMMSNMSNSIFQSGYINENVYRLKYEFNLADVIYDTPGVSDGFVYIYNTDTLKDYLSLFNTELGSFNFNQMDYDNLYYTYWDAWYNDYLYLCKSEYLDMITDGLSEDEAYYRISSFIDTYLPNFSDIKNYSYYSGLTYFDLYY